MSYDLGFALAGLGVAAAFLLFGTLVRDGGREDR